MDMEYENKPAESIGDWYQLWKNNDEPSSEDKPAAPSNTVGELLIDAIKLREYANFISQFAGNIEQDINNDIRADIFPIIPPTPQAVVDAGVIPQAIQPLKMAVDRRETVVKYAEQLSTLVKAIDSILSRVKFKEQ